MRQILGVALCAAVIFAAGLLVFQTQAGSHIGSMLGIAVYALARLESPALQLLGVKAVAALGLVRANCALLALVAGWHIMAGLRDFEDLPYKTILSGALALLGASSIWVFLQTF